MDSALNFARLKELVTLGRSKNGQEIEECTELKSNPSKEDIKQIMRDELNVWTEKLPKIMKIIVFTGNFDHAIFLSVVEAVFFSKKRKFGRFRNFKPNFKHLHRRNNMQNAFHQGKIGAQLNWLAPLSCVAVNP